MKNSANDYKKQVRRIKQFIRRAEKRGFSFNFELPKKPKRITQASINKLARITPEYLYKKAVYGGAETFGEVIPALQARKKERSTAAKKAAETRKKSKVFIAPDTVNTDESFYENVVISNWYATLQQFSNGEAYNLLRSWMGNTIRTEGKSATAEMIVRATSNGHMLTWDTVYKADNAVLYIGYMIDYLPDEGILYKEETLDKIEFMKRLGDALEQEEDWEYPL